MLIAYLCALLLVKYMMKDKNSVIGYLLLGVLLIGYFWFSQKDAGKLREIEKQKQDSITKVQAEKNKISPDSLAKQKTDSIANANKALTQSAGGFDSTLIGNDSMITVENNLAKYSFATKGGVLKQITLKQFNALNKNDGSLVNLQSAVKQVDGLYYNINTSANSILNTKDIVFTAAGIKSNVDGSVQVTLHAISRDQKKLSHVYTIKKDDYMIDLDIVTSTGANLFTDNTINASWNTTLDHKESDNTYDIQQAELSYKNEDGYDYYKLMGGKDKTYEKPVQWYGVHQRFFANIILAPKGKNFQNVAVNVITPQDSSGVLLVSKSTLKIPFDGATNKTNMQFYYGPNDYNILKKYDNSMGEMVNFGQGIFSFVKYINRYVVLPIFNFFHSFISNYGIIILLMTLFIRLLTSPLVYKSYLSGAKMKVLKPELEALKAKHGDDTQAYSMDQMKLYRQAGVNPLGGCIPSLIQLPIFISLYNFFNSNIALRGKAFAWSKDLSVFDSIANFGFEVPFYGGHVSLFTLLTVATTLLISLQSLSSTPDQGNPMLKYMPFIFPIIMLGFFNKLPAALTWYYFVSNLFTLILQFCIQKFILKPEKIRAEIDANKLKNKDTKSKWQLKLEEMQKTQQRAAELRNKNKK
jgi:YidC/Oxa1 family membrane protein insertase